MINNRHGPRGKPKWLQRTARGAPIQPVHARGRPPTGTVIKDNVTGLFEPERERYGRKKVTVSSLSWQEAVGRSEKGILLMNLFRGLRPPKGLSRRSRPELNLANNLNGCEMDDSLKDSQAVERCRTSSAGAIPEDGYLENLYRMI